MSFRQVASGFRSATDGSGLNGVNVLDYVKFPVGTSPNTSMRTAGATIIDTVSLTPSLTQKWSLLSVGFQTSLALVAGDQAGGTDRPFFGRLGKVYGGVILNQPPTPPGLYVDGAHQGAPYVSPMLALPQDPSMTALLWDPANDPLPPRINPLGILPLNLTPSGLLAVGGGISFPVPRSVIVSQQIGVGLWITPSLLGTPINPTINQLAGLLAALGTFTVNYDDGL